MESRTQSMSDSEACIAKARAHFDLLKSIYSLFVLSLPTIEDVENGRYKFASEDDLADMKNNLNLLAFDIKVLPVKLQQIDIDQDLTAVDVEKLTNAFDVLLGTFEGLVRDLDEAQVGDVIPEDAEYLGRFPKLVTLRTLRRWQHDQNASEKIACSLDDMSISKQLATPDSTSVFGEQAPLLRPESVASYINFTPSTGTIRSCRCAVESFEKVICDIFPHTVGRWDPEGQLGEVSEDEITIIREAHTFNRNATALFQLLAECIICEDEHVARLHLSGFRTRELEMLQVVDQHGWSPTCFSPDPDHRPITADLSDVGLKKRICTHMAAAKGHRLKLQGFFNETMVWKNCILKSTPYAPSTTNTSPSTLDHVLPGPNYQYGRTPRQFGELSRNILGVFLACSLFHLCGSPWLQHEFGRENIFILPNETPIISLDEWRPHVSCSFSHDGASRLLPEDVAALGVLILELETNFTAGWTDEDEDYDTGTKSNKMRLSRILREWKGPLKDSYYDIGLACFQFDTLVENLSSSNIDQDLRGLVVLFKCILSPLYQQLVTDKGKAKDLFQGVPGLSIPKRRQRTSNRKHLVLYDDWESIEPTQKSGYADEWMNGLTNSFSFEIKSLRSGPVHDLASDWIKGKTPEKIRIAILDTGIHPSDLMISGAKSRIIEKRSWVDSSEDWVDTYGHGTHVARLLVGMAPAADIYVAKISRDKTVDPKDMSRIAKAIDYAVEQWNVDIISMSFGFEDQNNAIAAAIDRASKADKLMFAAASNEGGNKKRSRPGRDSNVICIHACDGKGNKGDMNPSPLKKTENFTTLGIAVKSKWKKKTVYKSGTSFATPVAAAIAANVLEFANFRCNLDEREKKILYKREGMMAVFDSMSEERDGYDYVQPGRLWNGQNTDDEIAETIENILRER